MGSNTWLENHTWRSPYNLGAPVKDPKSEVKPKPPIAIYMQAGNWEEASKDNKKDRQVPCRPLLLVLKYMWLENRA